MADGPRGSQCPELEEHDCKNEQLPVKRWGSSKNPEGVAGVITDPHLMIFEWSWESREVPADQKLANVVPMFKKGKKEDPGNYKPVSLTSTPGKILEKIILGSIEKHLKDNTVIGHRQHGFRRSFSSLISFYDRVTHLVDQGKPVVVTFLDFSKSFDPVSPRILLDKVSSPQLDKHILWGMSSWLTG
ncbi:RNA-directed DNA polymerase from mobile element jockey-like protein [Pitangus sulphuratus]|nr:RNA-directed DNA polymerase from mobile element jockey-like protein [Pitangus sulphuratus]